MQSLIGSPGSLGGVMKKSRKNSPANHIAWINLVGDNTVHCANFGRRKAKESYSHTLTTHETAPVLSLALN